MGRYKGATGAIQGRKRADTQQDSTNHNRIGHRWCQGPYAFKKRETAGYMQSTDLQDFLARSHSLVCFPCCCDCSPENFMREEDGFWLASASMCGARSVTSWFGNGGACTKVHPCGCASTSRWVSLCAVSWDLVSSSARC